MRSLRTLLLPLLLAALLLGMVPPVGAAGDPDEPDYTCADEIFDRINLKLHGRKAPMDETVRADSVERLLDTSEGVVPGSVQRTGNDLTWMTEGGVACRFSPYLDSLATASTLEPDEEPARKYVTAEAPDVCLFAPSYGLDEAFEGQGGSYDTWARTLARFTGGQYGLYERTAATVDTIADAVETSAVVLIDSHGETDPNGRTSFICLQTGKGITARDYDTDPAIGGSHAYYGGRGNNGIAFFEVDGTVISNHMDGEAAGGLFWSGTCFGMSTDGLCGPLLKKGVGTVYGYSRDVSFGGDRCWMESFMDELTSGGTVAQAAAKMKKTWGAWDFSSQICARNGWSSGMILFRKSSISRAISFRGIPSRSRKTSFPRSTLRIL